MNEWNSNCENILKQLGQYGKEIMAAVDSFVTNEHICVKRHHALPENTMPEHAESSLRGGFLASLMRWGEKM